MKNVFYFLLMLLPFSCVETDELQIDFIDGEWELIDQTVNGAPVSPYVQVLTSVDPYTHVTLGTEPIQLENARFEFVPCRHPCLTKSFNLLSNNVKPLNGSWKYSQANQSITLYSLNNPAMTQDTLINSHRYYYYQFINNLSFKIQELNASKLKLSAGNEVFEFVKTD